ncbi:MAG TPA: 1-acyl-sn-glycerol-3-phosphate acyltransferase [Spirochaetales bacterium]|nr:1-acyl-sn-glycerol-3-phosphate acyltransferase [Spirochaetales bacterium]
MRYRTWNLKWFNTLLRWFYGLYLKLHYSMKARGTDILPKSKPYIIIANHVSVFDPFWISAFTGRPVYWVTSDGNMHSLILRLLLKLVGSIPKSKAISDIVTVNMIMDVLRKRKGVVGVFAEGQATWDGTTQPFIESTAKLLKLFKGTVIGVKIKGGYASRPRWSWNDRRGQIELEFFKLYDGPELKTKTPETIYTEIQDALAHNECAWIEKTGTRFVSKKRAEHLELAIFVCPNCTHDTSMRSEGNLIYCSACGASWRITSRYQLEGINSTLPEIFQRTNLSFHQILEERYKQYSTQHMALLSDAVTVFRGKRLRQFDNLGRGLAELHPDTISIHIDLQSNKQIPSRLFHESTFVIDFPLSQLEGLSVLKQQYFEFYYQGTMFRFKFPHRYQSGLRWYWAISYCQKKYKV